MSDKGWRQATPDEQVAIDGTTKTYIGQMMAATALIYGADWPDDEAIRAAIVVSQIIQSILDVRVYDLDNPAAIDDLIHGLGIGLGGALNVFDDVGRALLLASYSAGFKKGSDE